MTIADKIGTREAHMAQGGIGLLGEGSPTWIN
jgi:hypothetical protein